MKIVQIVSAILLGLLGLVEIIQLAWLHDSAISEIMRQFEAWSHQAMLLSPQGMAILFAAFLFSISGFMFEIASEEPVRNEA